MTILSRPNGFGALAIGLVFLVGSLGHPAAEAEEHPLRHRGGLGWSRVTLDKPEHAGRFLDARPADPNTSVAMETQDVPAVQAVDAKGQTWARIDRDYLPPPSRGKLASLDPALIVTPPPGLEAGYVPIATRQAAAE